MSSSVTKGDVGAAATAAAVWPVAAAMEPVAWPVAAGMVEPAAVSDVSVSSDLHVSQSGNDGHQDDLSAIGNGLRGF